MSGRSKGSRHSKNPSSSASGPSSSSHVPSGSGAGEEDAGPATGHSPRLGRKEAEHKRRVVENQYYDELMTLLSMISEHNMLKKMDKVTTLREAVICIRVYYDLAQKRKRAGTQSPPPLSLGEGVTTGTGAGGGRGIKSPTTRSPSSSLPSPALPSSNGSQQQQQQQGANGGGGGGGGGGAEVPSGLLDHGEMLSFFLDAHDSFLMIVSDSGRILYTTELVTSLLGQMQTRLVGQSIYDYIHEKHKNTIKSLFSRKSAEGRRLPDSPLLAYPSTCFNAHFKLYTGETNCQEQYLPFTCLSFLREWAEDSSSGKHTSSSSSSSSSRKPPRGEDGTKKACVVIIGKLPTSMTLMDLAVSTNEVNFEFEMRISRQGHIIDIDKHAVMVFGFSTSELIGTLFFEYVDPYHISDVGECMSKFLNDGIGTTMPYRIRTKGGRCIWLISKGYLSYDPWNNKLNHILLTNRVLGCDQVLPEHRFFENTKHLPVQDGRERYVPDLDTPTQPPALPPQAVVGMSVPTTSHLGAPPRTHPQQQTAASLTRGVSSPASSSGPLNSRLTTKAFPHLSAHSGALPPVRDTLNVAHQVFSNTRHQEGGGRPGEGEGGGAMHPGPPQSGGGGEEEGKQMGDHLQRELEEKSLKLLEMQKRLMEQEQQFNQDRMQFFRAAQTMMQELSRGVGGGGDQSSAAVATGFGNPSAILASMSKSLASVSSPLLSMSPSSSSVPPSSSSPSSSREQHGVLGRGVGGWGEPSATPTRGMGMMLGGGGGGGRPRPSHLSQQQTMSNPQHHQQQQHLHRIDSASSVASSSADHTPSHYHPAFSSYGSLPYPSPAPSFTRNSDIRAPSPADDGHFLNCLPYDCHPSLAEHNMQFFQQQQQQHQQQDSVFPMGPGGRLLQGDLGSSAGGPGGRRGDYGGLDLADILNST